MIAVVVTVLVCVVIYLIVKPPAQKICGSVNGPPVCSPRIKLRDGRYLAYKLKGATIENARFKVIVTHGFCTSKDTYIPTSDEWLEDKGICIITFDRPGYAESDPNPNRSPKTDAFDIQDLADQLKLGSKFYVIGLSIGCYPVWGCLRYIPHRLAGVMLGVPVVNYWWPSLPSELCNRVYTKLPLLDQWRLRIVHHFPKLAWILQRWFPFPTDKIEQQGAYESLHRDIVVSFGQWGFDPLDLNNPYPENSKSVHLWIGRKDGIVAVELQRHIAKRLPWIQCHEVPYGGHLFIHDPKTCEMIFKSLFYGENPSF
ncbi:hypothetical protein KSS87_013261 [Heliosperma pusillum]|nr:hypothetical protein KSS87_013261 [Heliosperma pusillum]